MSGELEEHRRRSLEQDDGRNDRDNPIVPFRMSDRLYIANLGTKINTILYICIAIAGFVGAGMAVRFL